MAERHTQPPKEKHTFDLLCAPVESLQGNARVFGQRQINLWVTGQHMVSAENSVPYHSQLTQPHFDKNVDTVGYHTPAGESKHAQDNDGTSSLMSRQRSGGT